MRHRESRIIGQLKEKSSSRNRKGHRIVSIRTVMDGNSPTSISQPDSRSWIFNWFKSHLSLQPARDSYLYLLRPHYTQFGDKPPAGDHGFIVDTKVPHCTPRITKGRVQRRDKQWRQERNDTAVSEIPITKVKKSCNYSIPHSLTATLCTGLCFPCSL